MAGARTEFEICDGWRVALVELQLDTDDAVLLALKSASFLLSVYLNSGQIMFISFGTPILLKPTPKHGGKSSFFDIFLPFPASCGPFNHTDGTRIAMDDGILSENRALSPFSRAALCAMSETAFFDGLLLNEREIVLEAFFQLDIASKGTKAPREFQLKHLLAFEAGNHVSVRAGTGSGKTLAIILPILLHRDRTSLLLVPLKVIQQNHVRACATRFSGL